MNWVAPTKKAAKTTKTIARAGVCWVTEAIAAVKMAISRVTLKKCSLVCLKALNEIPARAPPTKIFVGIRHLRKTNGYSRVVGVLYATLYHPTVCGTVVKSNCTSVMDQ